MATLANPLFIVCSVLFWGNQIVEAQGVFLTGINSYLDDVCALPITLGLALWVQRTFTFRDPSYQLSIWHLLFTVLYFGLIFELILPHWSQAHVADPWDVLAYSAGAWLFFQWGQPMGHRHKVTSKHQ